MDKDFICNFERESLSPLSYRLPPDAPDSDRINHRCFQLQVLMDVAYIQGQLEGYDIIRRISPDSYDLAQHAYQNSDGSEYGMLAVIDQIYLD